jgi:hypothetical protein
MTERAASRKWIRLRTIRRRFFAGSRVGRTIGRVRDQGPQVDATWSTRRSAGGRRSALSGLWHCAVADRARAVSLAEQAFRCPTCHGGCLFLKQSALLCDEPFLKRREGL